MFIIASGITTSTGEFLYVGLGLLIAGLPLTYWNVKSKTGSGSEQLILSPGNIQLLSGKTKRPNQPVTVQTQKQLSTHNLRNCYLEAGYEEALALTMNGENSQSIDTTKTSGIYFVDDQEKEYLFRTTGLTRRGKLLETFPDALPETRWIYDIVQTYLKATTTPSATQTPDLLETQTPEIAPID